MKGKAQAKIPAWTHVVLKTITEKDDFVSAEQLVQLIPHITKPQLAATISHLAKHRAIDCVEGNGRLWWFSTPDSDNRTKHLEERTPEAPGSRAPRRKRRVIVDVHGHPSDEL